VAQVSVVGPGGGEVVLSGPVQMRILEDGSTTQHRLGVAEITIAPHTDGPPQHRHARHDEGFYVVSGTARFTIGATVHEAAAGTFVMIPPGAPHTFANPGDEVTVLLNTFTPDLYVQYFRDLRDMIAAGRPMTSDAIVDVMGHYATVPSADFADFADFAGPPAAHSDEETSMTSTTTYSVTAGGIGPVEVTVTERGEGRPFLLLHGGGGLQTVSGFADLLGEAGPARVIMPTHPGFGGTHRPDALDTVRGLAALYVALLEQLGLTGVTVAGNSIGGWIAAEMALLGPERISSAIIIDGVGIDVPGHPVADFFNLTLDQVSQLSYHDPVLFRIDPAAMPAAQRDAMAGNRAALAVYSGTSMTDPTLRDRLKDVSVPVLVLWGDSDQIADADYGRAYADAIPGAVFQLLTETGHLPQIETPQQLLAAISAFAGSGAGR